MNGKPKLSKKDEAVERRLRDIPFRFTFRPEHKLDKDN